ncbi:tRNA pseudouridine(55) synthase TruB [Patescibacteria group bacterium]|nr:tRNA pseudouridine(55) synthase TruB [Patescibacteria group bacterium]
MSQIVEGILLVNKPSKMTSHDVVDELRKITSIRKIGHTGTLDPFAEGLLVCLIGRKATKLSESLRQHDKEYIATIKFGQETDTYDLEGKVVEDKGQEQDIEVKAEQLEEILKTFQGDILQEPPMFSAKKVKGQKLYDLARKGISIKREKAPVTIHETEILNVKEGQYPEVKLRVACGSGTYIRSLAHDIGKQLGVGAHLIKLERTKVGDFELDNAVKLAELDLNTVGQQILMID